MLILNPAFDNHSGTVPHAERNRQSLGRSFVAHDLDYHRIHHFHNRRKLNLVNLVRSQGQIYNLR